MKEKSIQDPITHLKVQFSTIFNSKHVQIWAKNIYPLAWRNFAVSNKCTSYVHCLGAVFLDQVIFESHATSVYTVQYLSLSVRPCSPRPGALFIPRRALPQQRGVAEPYRFGPGRPVAQIQTLEARKTRFLWKYHYLTTKQCWCYL